MVNLAKLRKKANEKKEEGRESAAAAAAKSAPVEEAKTAAIPEEAPDSPAPKKKQKKESSAPSSEQKEGPSVTEEQGIGSSATKGSPAAEIEASEPTAAQVSKLEAFKATAGRAKEFARSSFEAGIADEERVELLMFAMAGEQYAIDIERIAEIINPRKPTPVPNAPPAVVGIISLRGTIVTMLDLRRELGHDPGYTAGPETRTIVVEDRGGLAGFVVDRVLRVVKVAVSEIQSHPVVSLAEQRDAIRGVFRHGSALTVILDIEKLLGASD
jgi:purine-binding chemotaxis protein CheW